MICKKRDKVVYKSIIQGCNKFRSSESKKNTKHIHNIKVTFGCQCLHNAYIQSYNVFIRLDFKQRINIRRTAFLNKVTLCDLH